MSRDFLPAMYTQQEVKDAQLPFLKSTCLLRVLEYLSTRSTANVQGKHLE